MLCQKTQMIRAGLQTNVKLLTRARRLTGRRKDLLNLGFIKKQTTSSRILYSQGRLCEIGSGYLRLSKGEEVQVLMKASEEDREDAVGWFFRSERV